MKKKSAVDVMVDVMAAHVVKTMKPSHKSCRSCGRTWVKHHGIVRTCAALQVALEGLRQIADLPRGGRARQNARATVAFIETQLGFK